MKYDYFHSLGLRKHPKDRSFALITPKNRAKICIFVHASLSRSATPEWERFR